VLIEGCNKVGILANGILLVHLGQLGDPFLRDELEEHVDKNNRGGHAEGDSEGSCLDWPSLKDGSEEPGEACEELHGENNQEDQPGHEVKVEAMESV